MLAQLAKRNHRGGAGGFTFLELTVCLLVIVLLAAVIVFLVSGMFGGTRVTAMETELDVVKTAIDTYAVQSQEWPTATGRLPAQGQRTLIDFYAGFEKNGKTYRLCPHFLTNLPRHGNEGVWYIDSSGLVSLDINPEEW